MKKTNSLEKKLAKLQFTFKRRREFYNQVVSLSESGVSRVDALRMIWDISSLEGKKPGEWLPIIVGDVLKRLQDGATFGAALKPWIPGSEYAAIEAIDASSDFAGNMKEFLFMSEKQNSIRWKIIGGLIYPVFLMAITVGVLVYFSMTVVPTLAQTLPPERWTGASRALHLMSVFARDHLPWLVLAIIVLLPAILVSLPRWAGRSRNIADRLPFYSTYRMYTGINFITSVSALSRSGLSIPGAVERVRASSSPYVRSRVDKILRRMLDGDNFGAAMYRAGTGWPDNTMALNIKVFTETRDLSEHMTRMARNWLVESEKRVEASMSALRMGAMFAMFLVIMVIVAGIYGINIQLSSGSF